MVLVFFTTPGLDECRCVSTAFHRVNGERREEHGEGHNIRLLDIIQSRIRAKRQVVVKMIADMCTLCM